MTTRASTFRPYRGRPHPGRGGKKGERAKKEQQKAPTYPVFREAGALFALFRNYSQHLFYHEFTAAPNHQKTILTRRTGRDSQEGRRGRARSRSAADLPRWRVPVNRIHAGTKTQQPQKQQTKQTAAGRAANRYMRSVTPPMAKKQKADKRGGTDAPRSLASC